MSIEYNGSRNRQLRAFRAAGTGLISPTTPCRKQTGRTPNFRLCCGAYRLSGPCPALPLVFLRQSVELNRSAVAE
jgi:hypothetical protein